MTEMVHQAPMLMLLKNRESPQTGTWPEKSWTKSCLQSQPLGDHGRGEVVYGVVSGTRI